MRKTLTIRAHSLEGVRKIIHLPADGKQSFTLHRYGTGNEVVTASVRPKIFAAVAVDAGEVDVHAGRGVVQTERGGRTVLLMPAKSDVRITGKIQKLITFETPTGAVETTQVDLHFGERPLRKNKT